MENYICINGKKAELTEEQMKALGIELPKANPFERVNVCDTYYMIMGSGEIDMIFEHNVPTNHKHFNAANYCTDKAIMEQRALHEALNRLLWRFSMTHNGHEFKYRKANYFIYYDHEFNRFKVESNSAYQTVGAIYFATKEIAQQAIEEIIKPFMKAHPEFKL